MTNPDPSPEPGRPIAIIVLLVALGVAALFIGYVVISAHTQTHRLGFHEQAEQAGISFVMHNLPNEQGEQRFRINLYDHGAGLAVGDFDYDGRDDIYFLNQHGTTALYRNKGDGTFEDVTAKARVGLDSRVSVGATFADYDNDGQLDLFLTNTAHWTTDNFDFTNRNYEGKGSLEGLMSSTVEYNILYHNNGNGTFTHVTDKAGMRGRGWAGDVAVFDYDDDGFLDVFVPSIFGRGQL